MKKYKLQIAYDGTEFGGWQIQPNAVTIQQLLQEALHTILQEEIAVTGAGRTDAGVHALGQTAHFSTDKPFNLQKMIYSLNGLLPKAIRVLTLEEVHEDFHARYSAKKKIYHYHLTLSPVQLPFFSPYRLHIRGKFNLEALKTGCRHFLGTHDFTSFANQPHLGAACRNAVRTIDRLDVVEEQDGVRLEFEGKSFLYKMVRNMVGTLLEVGEGKLKPDDIPKILEKKCRKAAGRAAPAHGLFLVKIEY